MAVAGEESESEFARRFEREIEDKRAAKPADRAPIAGGAVSPATADVPELDRDKILTLGGSPC